MKDHRKLDPQQSFLPDLKHRVCLQCGEPFVDVAGDDSAWCLDCRLEAEGAKAENPADLVTLMSPGRAGQRLTDGCRMLGRGDE